ncbi:MAG: PIN domain-containing protein [Haloechinothrix sp.]
MALTHLADTSVLTRLSHADIRKAIGDLLVRRALGRCALSDLEVGFSARNAGEWDVIQRALRPFGLIAVSPVDVARARGVQRTLAALGLKDRKVPDLLIAAAAEREDLILLHYDRDFDLIAEATGQPTQWIVERGRID